MTTTPAPSHADLEALEGRIINRISELELRLVRDFHSEFRTQSRWTIGLILPLYALIVAVILTVAITATNILSKLP